MLTSYGFENLDESHGSIVRCRFPEDFNPRPTLPFVKAIILREGP